MLTFSALRSDRDLLQEMETVQVITATEQTNRQLGRATTILWPNRQDGRELCAKTARRLLTDNTMSSSAIMVSCVALSKA